MVTFTVYGIAQPKGSLKAFMRPGARFPSVTEDNPRTRPWAALVKDAACQACGGRLPFASGIGVAIDLVFVLPRPKSLAKRVSVHVKKPDLDKLTRAVLDACKGVVWSDDAQVVEVTARKQYAVAGEQPRALVEVEATSPAAALPYGKPDAESPEWTAEDFAHAKPLSAFPEIARRVRR